MPRCASPYSAVARRPGLSLIDKLPTASLSSNIHRLTKLQNPAAESLLTEADPYPVEIFRGESASPILIVCDHAGNGVPQILQDRMPEPEDMARHIAIDVNARPVAQIVARELDSTLVAQRYSRLVIDMNRPLDSPELCPEVSDGSAIPFNLNLTRGQIDERIAEIFNPYHIAISVNIDNRDNPPAAMVAIHSFTPQLRDQPPRVWHADLISRTSVDLVLELREFLKLERPQLNFGVNDIFAVSDKSDYTLRTHAEARGLMGLSIEIRNDLLSSDAEIADWGMLLARGLKSIFADRIPNL